MKTIRILSLILAGVFLSSCQMGYYFSSAYNQLALLNQRVPVEDAMKDPTVDESSKRKLMLASEARVFAESKLALKSTKNYTTYVQLDRPHVTYVVSAAPKWELKHHLWSFPFVGKVPYKGFFNEKDAKEEEEKLRKKDLDTYLRGVSAYSTLGWFSDPLLSSMMRYSDHQLVNTIIHETVHATLFIKSSADFNERLATFLGNKGMELFYHEKEGPESPTLKIAAAENEDDDLFSKFISAEIKDLEIWYQKNKGSEEDRAARIREIQARFQTNILPQMKSKSFLRFSEINLNNARLLVYKTYMEDLSDFEKLFQLVGNRFDVFLEKCKKLEDAKNPDQALKDLIQSLEKST